MRCFLNFIKLKNLYNFFLFLALLNIFFSTANANSKIQEVKTIKSHPDLGSFSSNSDSGNIRLYVNQSRANSAVKVVAQLIGR